MICNGNADLVVNTFSKNVSLIAVFMIKVMLARVRMMMKLAVMLASLTLEFALAGELLVNRHFKGDIFSQKGELIYINFVVSENS